MTMRIHDGIPMMGTLRITVRDGVTMKVRQRFEIRNKITFLAADLLVELIAQRSTDTPATQQLIYSMRMGSSNTAASRSDSNLGAFTIGKVLGDTGKVTGAPGELNFIASLDTGDANSTTLREAGLFSAGPTPSVSNSPGTSAGVTRMIARQVYPDIPKTGAISVDYSWTIAFTSVP